MGFFGSRGCCHVQKRYPGESGGQKKLRYPSPMRLLFGSGWLLFAHLLHISSLPDQRYHIL